MAAGREQFLQGGEQNSSSIGTTLNEKHLGPHTIRKN